MPERMETAIRNYIAERMNEKLDDLHKKRDGALKKATPPFGEEKVLAEYAEEEEKIRVKFHPRNWLDDAFKKTSQLRMGTHIAKFTHGDIQLNIPRNKEKRTGSNVIYIEQDQQPIYLDSGALGGHKIDVAGNAAYAKERELLLLESEKGTLADLLIQGQTSYLRKFSNDELEYKKWCDYLLRAIDNTPPASNKLAKQVYFPVGENEYHLLSPLYSSSLSQEIFDKVHFSRFANESKEAREAKKAGKYSATPVVLFPNIAVTISGGSHAKNISQRNIGRGGRTYLLPATPPVWQKQVKPPIYLKDFFTYKEVNNQTYGSVRKLANFLSKVLDIESNLRIRRYRARLLDEIIDTVLNISCGMTMLPANWTDKADLPSHQKDWLDSGLTSQQANDWHKPVASDFADWLNGKLKKIAGAKFTFAKTEKEFWRDMFLQGIQDTRAGRRS